jgi:hypothetical protein
MGTITGLTADRMLAIEAASIVDGDVVGDDLFLIKQDGTPINVGSVRGAAGPIGPPGPAAVPPLVTVLPALPSNGQEVYLDASGGAGALRNVRWHLRYNGATSKWDYLGGPPLRAEVNVAQLLPTASVWTDLGTVGPSLLVPVAGTYRTSWSTVVNIATAGAQTAYTGPAVGAGTPAFSAKTALNNANQYQTTFQNRSMAWTAGQECRLRYRLQLAISTAFDERWLELLPEFLG